MKNYKHPLYKTWVLMIHRCHNPDDKDWLRYGGRGIVVCDAWHESFITFTTDVGDRPVGKTLNRINNDGNYKPSNCNWATPKEQAANSHRAKAKPKPVRQLTRLQMARIRLDLLSRVINK